MQDLIYRVRQKFRKLSLGGPPLVPWEDMLIPSSAKDQLLAETKGEFARVFYQHKGRVARKWLHYLDVYDRHLNPLRGSSVRLLEIGVDEGGSLEVWRKYLGPHATIFGIDINPASANRVDAPNQCRIGSQDDADFLRRVVKEMGGVDVVLDDGSHVAPHQAISFSALFPLLPEGGLYMIEDMHTSYWPGGFRGGLNRKGTAIELVKEMIDDMHRWYHKQKRPSHGPIGAIHVYDSLVVIEKRTSPQPRHIRISGTE
jgi:hypothetical protein